MRGLTHERPVGESWPAEADEDGGISGICPLQSYIARPHFKFPDTASPSCSPRLGYLDLVTVT